MADCASVNCAAEIDLTHGRVGAAKGAGVCSAYVSGCSAYVSGCTFSSFSPEEARAKSAYPRQPQQQRCERCNRGATEAPPTQDTSRQRGEGRAYRQGHRHAGERAIQRGTYGGLQVAARPQGSACCGHEPTDPNPGLRCRRSTHRT